MDFMSCVMHYVVKTIHVGSLFIIKMSCFIALYWWICTVFCVEWIKLTKCLFSACPANCKLACDQTTTECYGCDDGFYGTYCSQCEYYVVYSLTQNSVEKCAYTELCGRLYLLLYNKFMCHDIWTISLLEVVEFHFCAP